MEHGEALRTAIQAGDAAGVQRVLDTYPDLQRTLDDPIPGGHFGATALLVAVQEGRRDVVEVLLRAGADIDARSHWWAGGFGVLDGDSPLVPWLVERGAAVNAYAAARHGWMDRLTALVDENRAAARSRGGDGQTPLHVARTVEVAAFLLERGADIDALDVDHESTPAQYHVTDRPDVARFLVERGCRTDILMAVALGDLARVRRHLDEDPASIRTRVSQESFPMKDPRAGGSIYTWTLGATATPHSLARAKGHAEILALLNERTPPELVQENEWRMLPDAARHESIEDVRRMLDAGWPVDARGQHEGTALHWAAFHGNLPLVRLLLEHRASLEVRDQDHDGTPLGWATHGSLHGWNCQRGDYAGVVEALLDAGAVSPDVGNGLEASPLVLEVLRRERRKKPPH